MLVLVLVVLVLLLLLALLLVLALLLLALLLLALLLLVLLPLTLLASDTDIAKFKADGIPYFTRRQSLHDTGCDVFVQIPGNGIIFEMRSSKCCDTVASCKIKLQVRSPCRLC